MWLRKGLHGVRAIFRTLCHFSGFYVAKIVFKGYSSFSQNCDIETLRIFTPKIDAVYVIKLPFLDAAQQNIRAPLDGWKRKMTVPLPARPFLHFLYGTIFGRSA
jgi:hypothetical protein